MPLHSRGQLAPVVEGIRINCVYHSLLELLTFLIELTIRDIAIPHNSKSSTNQPSIQKYKKNIKLLLNEGQSGDDIHHLDSTDFLAVCLFIYYKIIIDLL